MPSIGERLKREREHRNTTLEEMAEASGVGRGFLEALEGDDIGALPGPAFGKLYIRAYADILGFEPQPWIDDYDREQRLARGASTEISAPAPAGSRPVAAAIARWKKARAAVVQKTEQVVEPVAQVEPVPRTEPVPPVEAAAPVDSVEPPGPAATVAPFRTNATPEHPQSARRLLAPLFLGGVAIASAIYFGLQGTGGHRPPVVPAPEPRPSEAPLPTIAAPEPLPSEPPPLTIAAPEMPSAATAHAARAPAAPGAITVSESGVGRRIVSLRLEGEGDRFAPGQRVCFSTRVLGGRRGGIVRHVWLREGKIEQTITLPLGGPDWRTHSNKTLGHAGSWAVEARDDKGRVLARVAFACGPGAQ